MLDIQEISTYYNRQKKKKKVTINLWRTCWRTKNNNKNNKNIYKIEIHREENKLVTNLRCDI